MTDDRSPSWLVSYSKPSSFLDEWSSAKVLSWTLLDVPNARIEPPRDLWIYDPAAHSWWQAVVDLLVYGKGWTNLAHELRRWRIHGYAANDPVLNFVQNTWGKTIMALEWYLLEHQLVNQQIFEHATNACGQRDEYVQLYKAAGEAQLIELMFYLSNLQHDLSGRKLMETLIKEEDAHALIASFDSDEEFTRGSDPAHLASHFCHHGVEWSSTITPQDSMMIVGNSAVLELAQYEGWYHKLHDLRNESLKDDSGLTDIEIINVNVMISGLGSLGTFIYDDDFSCFIRNPVMYTRIRTPKSLPKFITSPRFDFVLNDDMLNILTPLMEHFDSYEDEPIEELEIASCDLVGFSHALGYCIAKRNEWQETGDFDWSRVNGEWEQGWMNAEGRHYLETLAKMARNGLLDPDEPPSEYLMDNSTIYDVKPWAARLVIALWDTLPSFPSALAVVAEYEPLDPVSLSELTPSYTANLTALIKKELASPGSSDHTTSVERLSAFLSGEVLTAYELFDALTSLHR